MKLRIWTAAALMVLTLGVFGAQAADRDDNRYNRHLRRDRRALNYDRYERGRDLAQGRYYAAGREQREINARKRDMRRDAWRHRAHERSERRDWR